eukprot:6174023-Pleurochrysis_carterae.AAC.7
MAVQRGRAARALQAPVRTAPWNAAGRSRPSRAKQGQRAPHLVHVRVEPVGAVEGSRRDSAPCARMLRLSM